MDPALPRIQKEMAYVLGDHAIRSAYQLALTNSIPKIKTFYNQVLLQYNIVLLFFHSKTIQFYSKTTLIQPSSHSAALRKPNLLYSAGDIPITCLKAEANLLALSYPYSAAISRTESSVSISRRAADRIFMVFI